MKRSVLARGALVASLSVLAMATACERKAIPPRHALPEVKPFDPLSLLEGGEVVFSDDFERASPGVAWTAAEGDWVIEGGALHSTAAENKGIWLADDLPERVRISFDVRSEELKSGKPFPGDVKCEVFASEAKHQAGYVLINGGWGNKLDVIARLDEHGSDRAEQPAAPVEPGVAVRWTVARTGDTLYWFRGGKLHMLWDDSAPLPGRRFGFNNWRSNVYFDNLEIVRLP